MTFQNPFQNTISAGRRRGDEHQKSRVVDEPRPPKKRLQQNEQINQGDAKKRPFPPSSLHGMFSIPLLIGIVEVKPRSSLFPHRRGTTSARGSSPKESPRDQHVQTRSTRAQSWAIHKE